MTYKQIGLTLRNMRNVHHHNVRRNKSVLFNSSPLTAADMEDTEREFQDFFHFCKKQRFTAAQELPIIQLLNRQARIKIIKRWTGIVMVFLVPLLMWHVYDNFAWILTAFQRILLIQLLPYWNWTPLYNTKCILERADKIRNREYISPFNYYETGNCLLCATIEQISTLENVSFSHLESYYLERGLPVVVTDSNAQQNLSTLLNHINNKGYDFLSSEPCDLATNLMLHKLFNTETAIQKVKALLPSEPWFLQLRNCQFKAVKASRRFMPRPYFYPFHLEPYYSSWLLAANNFTRSHFDIYVSGLIFVQQLSGHFEFRLQPKQPCVSTCPIINIHLNLGECLLFSTDLWRLSYGMQSVKKSHVREVSVATVLEIDWQF